MTTTTNLRVLVYPVKGVHCTSYKCEVKGRGTRVTVGTFDSEHEARTAGERYIETGTKPPPAKRGPKGPRGDRERQRTMERSRTPREFRTWGPQPPPARSERLALIRAIAGRLQ